MTVINDEINKLLKESGTLTASVYDLETKQPLISTHPYFYSNGKFYILSTKVASQTAIYEKESVCSIIIVGEQTVAENLFSRRRVSLLCQPKLIHNTNEVKEMYRDKLGSFAHDLLDVSDFMPFYFEPIEGLYFRGFGRAYQFTSNAINFIHIKEPHKPKSGMTMAKILKSSLS